MDSVFPGTTISTKLITVLSGAGTVILLKQQIKRSPAGIMTSTVILRGGEGGQLDRNRSVVMSTLGIISCN